MQNWTGDTDREMFLYLWATGDARTSLLRQQYSVIC